jgi:tRNA1Val (adenine37-N6)-methyltransferase
MSYLKPKGLTISIIFEAESANYGEGVGNVASLKKISRGKGNQYTYISRQAIRYNIGEQLGEEYAPVKAEGSVKLNNLQDKIEILNIDLKDALEYLDAGSFDAVISNPPYKLNNTGIINSDDKKAISRHEIKCTLEDVISTASQLLKQYGRFYMVHRPDRLADIMCFLRKYKLEPKQIRFVHPKVKAKPNMILIRASKNGNPELKFDPPLYIYDDEGSYTEDVYKIYGMEDGQI